jgi:putative glycosyltransferase (TIGR04372 family)
MKKLRDFFKIAIAKRRGRAVELAVFMSYSLLRIIPARLAFALIVLCEYTKLPGRAALKRGFAPIVVRDELGAPGFVLSSVFTRAFSRDSVAALNGVGAHRECCDFVATSGPGILSADVNELWARSLFELGRFSEAREAIGAFASREVMEARPHTAEFKAHLDLIAGDETAALTNLEIAVRSAPGLLRPHQNLAGRYPSDYSPTELDALSGPSGRLFDAYNYVGQRVIHVGQGHLAASLFAAAMAAQERLRTNYPVLSAELGALLDRLGIKVTELIILPVEWYTQIGHQGLLDILFRMRDLGWWRGKVIFLMPADRVANRVYQMLVERCGHVLVPGVSVDLGVARELFSLQRWCGMCFNAFELPSGNIVPWQEAGALAMRQWESAARGDPVRAEFDQIYGADLSLHKTIVETREFWGIKPDDWYVCLHMRDASHYGELSGTGQSHRNAGVDNYVSTLEHITSRGGWVIKLGGPRSPRLPKMNRVVDYARGPAKSEMLDVYLIRNARYFIGTTSGLTNVAISLGVPCALVNCITTDAQPWSSRVRFALKRIRLGDGRFVNQRQLTFEPWRWRAFTSELLARYGATVVENTEDEILETVKEIECLAAGNLQDYEAAFPEAADLLVRWCNSLALPHFYGNAKPNLYYVHKYGPSLDQSELPDRCSESARTTAAKKCGSLSGAPKI